MPVAANCNMECILYPYACLSPGLRKVLEEKNRYVIIKLQTEDAVQRSDTAGHMADRRKGEPAAMSGMGYIANGKKVW